MARAYVLGWPGSHGACAGGLGLRRPLLQKTGPLKWQHGELGLLTQGRGCRILLGMGQSYRHQHEGQRPASPPIRGLGSGHDPTQAFGSPGLPDSEAQRHALAMFRVWRKPGPWQRLMTKVCGQGEGRAGLEGGQSLKEEVCSRWGHSPRVWGSVWDRAGPPPRPEGTAAPVPSCPRVSHLGLVGSALLVQPHSVPGLQGPSGPGGPEEGTAGFLHPYIRGP